MYLLLISLKQCLFNIVSDLFLSGLFLLVFSQPVFSHDPLDESMVNNLTQLAQMYIHFEESNFELLQNDPHFQSCDEVTKNQRNTMSVDTIKLAKDFLNSLECVKTGKNTINQLLSVTFYLRFGMLQSRMDKYQAYKEGLKRRRRGLAQPFKSLFLPTDLKTLELFKYTSKDYDPQTPRGRCNLMIAQMNTDRYQIFNKMIFELVHAIGFKKLTQDNQLWLQCSPSLHDFLSGKNQDPGHPDQAIRFAQVEAANENQGRDDYSLSSYYIIKTLVGRVLNPMLGARNFATSARITISYSDYDLYLLRREAMLQKKMLYENISNVAPPPPLPTLDFLNIPDEPIDAVASSPLSESNANIATEELERAQEAGPSVPVAPVANHVSSPIPSVVCPSSLSELKTSQFQTEVAKQGVALLKLKPIDEQWLRELFEHTMNIVDYRDFKRIWMHINGPNSIQTPGKGGSHRKLLNSHGHFAGSIFTHGDAQQYSNQYHGHLRANFEAIGITQDSFSINPS